MVNLVLKAHRKHSHFSCFHLIPLSPSAAVEYCMSCMLPACSIMCKGCCGLFVQLLCLLADLVVTWRWLITEMLTAYPVANRSGCANHFTGEHPWNVDVLSGKQGTIEIWIDTDRHGHKDPLIYKWLCVRQCVFIWLTHLITWTTHDIYIYFSIYWVDYYDKFELPVIKLHRSTM